MMMINVPLHFKVTAWAVKKERENVAGAIIHQYHYPAAHSFKLKRTLAGSVSLKLIN